MACSQHWPGHEADVGLVGKIVEDGFEIHFTRPLCTIKNLIGEQNPLSLDGVELGTATFVRGPESYFKIETNAETSQRLLEALGQP